MCEILKGRLQLPFLIKGLVKTWKHEILSGKSFYKNHFSRGDGATLAEVYLRNGHLRRYIRGTDICGIDICGFTIAEPTFAENFLHKSGPQM